VDQPVGVGFSFNNNSKKVDNSRDAADHFINFMVNFFKNNRNFTLNDNPIYLAG
jgi:carboxypeptidase C (cathepsin A)